MFANLSYKEILGIVAGLLSLLAYWPYILSILRRKTIPSRTSWWIWALVGFLVLTSYYGVGARNTIWIPLVFFICPLVVAILSLKFGARQQLDRLDKACLFIALGSTLFWILFDLPSVTLFINIGIDLVGFLPTFKKTYFHPESENKAAWILFFVGSIFNLLAIEKYDFSVILYPVYMTVADIVMLILLFRPQKHDSRNIP